MTVVVVCREEWKAAIFGALVNQPVVHRSSSFSGSDQEHASFLQVKKKEKRVLEGKSAELERFLRARVDNVKKAAKNLRAVLSWWEIIGADHIIADEFSSELSAGMAYVAGHDDENHPVVVRLHGRTQAISCSWVAQKLYEGRLLSEQTSRLITYLRMDAFHVKIVAFTQTRSDWPSIYK